MTRRTRVLLSLQTGLGLVLAGLGHYYAATGREVYPLDGYVYYFFAALSFVWAWRTAQLEKGAAPHELQRRVPRTWRTLTQTLARVLVVTVAAPNGVAALIALVIPSAPILWGGLWGLAALAWLFYILPAPSQPPQHDRTVAARTYLDTVPAIGGRVNPIGLAVSIGLLALGQIMAATLTRSSTAAAPDGQIAQAINEALRLDLSGDPAVVLGGAALLALGAIGYAFSTRRLGLCDHPPLIVTEIAAKGQRTPRGWLAAAFLATLLWLGTLGSLVGKASGWSSVLPFAVALLLMSACWWQVDRWRGVRHRVQVARGEAIVLGAALIAILIVFTFRLGDVPNSMWGDEGAFFVTARDIAHNAVTPDFFGLGTYALPMPGAVYQSLWISLLGANFTGWRFASAFAAWLAMTPLYFLARSTVGRRVAWVSLALYAASPYLLTYARMGYETAQGLAPVTAAFAFVWIAVRRDSRLYAFLAGGAAGLGFYTTPSARMVIVLIPLWLLWMWIARRVRGKTIGHQVLTVLLGVVVVAAPPIVYGLTRAPEAYTARQFESAFNNLFYARDLYPQDQLTTNGDPIPVGNQQLINAPELYGPLIARGVLRTALALHASSLVHEHYLIDALADPLEILYLLGAGGCLARMRRPGYALWPLWLFGGGLLTSALSAYPPRAALLTPVIPALVVLGALGLVSGVDVLGSLVSGIGARVTRYALIGVTALLVLVGWRAYFVEMPQRFPPDLDNAMLWQAQSLPRGSSIVLILPDTWPKAYQLWGPRELDLGVQFHTLSKIDLNTADWHSLCPATCRIFFAASDRDWALSFLAQAFGDQPLIEYRDAQGGVQAYLFAPKQ